MKHLKDLNKKILLIGEFPPPYGGMAVQTRYLFTNLLKEGINVNIVPVNRNGNWRKNRVLSKPVVRTIVNYVLFIQDFLGKLNKSDLLHIVCCSGLSFYLFAVIPSLLAWRKKKRIIINYKGGDCDNFLCKNLLMTKPIFRRSAVIVPSGFLKSVMAKYGIDAAIIENIMDLEKFRFRIKSPAKPVFAVTRHLEPIYNVKSVIKAFFLISRKIPNALLHVAGKGSEFHMLKRLTKSLGIESQVIFHGEIPNAEMPDLLNKVYVLLNGSIIDNLPVSILEAFSCGIPVVTSEAGGIPWLVKDGQTGLLVEINNYHEMACKAIRLLNDQQLYERVARNAFSEVRKYQWDSIKDKLLRIYSIDGAF